MQCLVYLNGRYRKDAEAVSFYGLGMCFPVYLDGRNREDAGVGKSRIPCDTLKILVIQCSCQALPPQHFVLSHLLGKSPDPGFRV